MFRGDIKELKAKMAKKISEYYIEQPYINEHFYVDPALESLKQAILRSHKDSVEQANHHMQRVIKPFMEEIINDLIDELYTQQDFNEDLGLYK